VNDVLALAQRFGQGGEDLVFAVDRAAAELAAARATLAQAGERLNAAVAAERRLAREEARRLARAEAATTLSQRLALQKRATLTGVARERAKRRVEGLRRDVGAAEQVLADARAASQGPAFAVSGTAVLADPAAGGDRVFPVGGGAAVVSVGADHHDYPAADIAAPEGSPVYALADAVVVRAWRVIDPRCGIGATIATGDGLTWTYCHLSYLEPSVEAGAVLEAGTLVGLVGSTGHSTGPHLHLQLQPPDRFPQELDWFRAFAGTAFSWQGEAAPGEPAGTRSLARSTGGSLHRVFAVVPPSPAVQPAGGDVVLFSR
jgi:murein DD-endopeptidase MepM/ murein hydrolase activator NlpD